MMVAPDERKSNSGLLDFADFDKKMDKVYNLTDVIAVDRPLRDLEEARAAAPYMNNVMAFVEFGTRNHDGFPDTIPIGESVPVEHSSLSTNGIPLQPRFKTIRKDLATRTGKREVRS